MHVVADSGRGRPAVLLHGQPGGARDFAAVLPPLAGRGLRVVTVDRPGYGANPRPPTGFAGNAASLGQLLDQVSPDEPALLLALSWAAGPALCYAAAHPERVAGLLLGAPVGAPEAISAVDRLMARPVADRAFSRLLPHLTWMVESVSGSRLTPAERGLGRRQGGALTARDWEAFRVEQRALVAETPALWTGLGRAAHPVTVVQGTRDVAVPPAAGRLVAERLDARYVPVDAGHLLHLEVPALLAAELADLASGAPPDPPRG